MIPFISRKMLKSGGLNLLTHSYVVFYLKVDRLWWLRGRLLGRPLPLLVSSLNIKDNFLQLFYAWLPILREKVCIFLMRKTKIMLTGTA